MSESKSTEGRERALRLVTEDERPGRSSFYVFGDYETRFALLRYPRSYGLITRPKGGLIIGRLGIWWGR